jgi:hyaluronan synthase
MNRTPAFILVSTFTLVALTYVMLNHLQYVTKFTNLAVLYTIMFIHLAVKTLASLAAKPHVAAPGFDLDSMTVDIVVPIYNEDPKLLAAGINSFADQKRRPQTVWLVDDGSKKDGEPFQVLQDAVVLAAIAKAEASGISVECIRQENSGKREA